MGVMFSRRRVAATKKPKPTDKEAPKPTAQQPKKQVK